MTKNSRKLRRILPFILVITLTLLVIACVIFILTDTREPQKFATAEEVESETEHMGAVRETGGITVKPRWESVEKSELDESLFAWKDGIASYPGASLGVDVSSHQREIDWAAAAKGGIRFAVVRLGYRGYTEGGLFEDEYFRRNAEGAGKNGIELGVYFFSQAVDEQEAREEAQFVLAALEGIETSVGIFFDWETITNDFARTDTVELDTVTAMARAFCDEIIAAGRTAGVYFNINQLGYAYDLDELSDVKFWLAEYAGAPSYAYHTDMWQFSAAGSIPGISANVDLDLMW